MKYKNKINKLKKILKKKSNFYKYIQKLFVILIFKYKNKIKNNMK